MKRVLSFLLTAITILTSLPLSALQISASPFAGGDGSEGNPYLVATPEALNAVRDNPTAHYLQIADIDMSSWGNWTPINSFRGVYDGQKQTISNLKIDVHDTSTYATAYGLFAEASGGKIKNVILKDINYSITKKGSTEYVHGGANYSVYVGGICGNYGSIENCTVSGSITVDALSSQVGGICGCTYSDITNCFNSATLTVNLTENSACGGIAGSNSGKITLSTNAGAINASSNKGVSVGGICGINKDGRVQNCLNSGNLTCLNDYYYKSGNGFYAGGIVGRNGNVSNSVNYGSINAIATASKNDDGNYTYWLTGGILGYCNEQYESGAESCFNLCRSIISCYNNGGTLIYINTASRINGSVTLGGMGNYTPSFDNCYSLDETLLNEKIVIPPEKESMELKKQGKNLTAAQCLLESSYSGFDFKKSWIIDASIGGAILRDTPYTSVPIDPETPQEIIADFNDLIYRADYLTKGKASILTDPAIHSLLLTNNFTPSRIIVDAHPENMQTVAAAWEALKATVDAADGDASQVLKQNTKQEDLITAYILGAVGNYTDYQFADAVKNNFKHTQNLVKVLCELNGTYAMAGDEFKEFIKGKDGDVEKLLRDYYEKNDPTMSALLKTKKGISVVSSVISTANSIEDVVSEISSYSKLYGINESTKEALLLMYKVCPDESKALKKALKLTAEIVSSANEEMIKDISEREFAFSLCRETAYAVTDKLWGYMTDAFVDSCPVAKGYVALAKMELTVMDKFFGIDARTEQYFKLCTLNEVDRVAALAVHQAMNDYIASPTSEKAATFLSAIELKFGFVDQSYNESIKYSEVITDSGILQKMENGFRNLFGIENVNVLKESLIGAEKAKNSLHCTILTAWISELDAEDHSLAKNYYEYREAMFTRYDPENANDFIEVFRNAAKQYSIHCPVNVQVFSPSGELIAEVGKDSIFASEDVAVIYDHGEKEIIFFEEGDYILSCEGYDDGDMDIEITEFDSEGNIVRKVNYNNIPVAPSSIHAMSGNEVKTNDGNSLPFDYDSDRASKKHKVSIENGVISGYLFERDAAKGERIEISAIIPEGYRFVGWQATGSDVVFEDTKASSTSFFMPESDIEISAKFKKLDRDDDEDKPNTGIPVIIIFVIAGGALITLSGIAILIVMIKERKKNSKKEQGNEANSL